MKKMSFWSIVFIAVMSLPIIIACGGDDNENSSNKVDGVNVTDGKRIQELQLLKDNYPQHLERYKVEYDTKGRIITILANNQFYSNDKEEFKEIASIDYDLRVIRIYDTSYSRISDTFGFALNNYGYISQIGTCTLNYDSKGYLTDVEEPRGISSLIYDGNDLIKASVTQLRKGNIFLYYVTYGNNDKQGDLFINIRYTDKERSEIWKYPTIVGLIAYQSGLFGKVTQSFIHFKSRNEVSSLVELINDRDPKNIRSYSDKLTFIYE